MSSAFIIQFPDHLKYSSCPCMVKNMYFKFKLNMIFYTCSTLPNAKSSVKELIYSQCIKALKFVLCVLFIRQHVRKHFHFQNGVEF